VEMAVNPMLITSLRNPEPGNKNFTPSVRCLVNLSDGKFVTVRETCEEVKGKIQTRKEPPR
jgi:hypothetical protein